MCGGGSYPCIFERMMELTGRQVEDIDRLITPCGEVVVTDEKGERVLFSVRRYGFAPYRIFVGTPDEQVIEPIANYEICIDSRRLRLGERYRIRMSGIRLEFGGADERTIGVVGTANGYSLGLGAYDPNDEEKMDQDIAASEDRLLYDKSRFVQYDLEMLPDFSGFSFELLDRSVAELRFPVAWIGNPRPENARFRDAYEGAVNCWTT